MLKNNETLVKQIAKPLIFTKYSYLYTGSCELTGYHFTNNCPINTSIIIGIYDDDDKNYNLNHDQNTFIFSIPLVGQSNVFTTLFYPIKFTKGIKILIFYGIDVTNNNKYQESNVGGTIFILQSIPSS